MLYNLIITLFNSIFNSNVRLWGFFFSIFEVIFFSLHTCVHALSLEHVSLTS